MAVLGERNPLDNPKNPNVFDAYGGAIKQTGTDYDSLMQAYRGLLGGQGNSFSPLRTSQTPQSSFSPQQAKTIGNANPLSFNPLAMPNAILYNPARSGPSVQFSPTSATTGSYRESSDVRNSLNNLRGLAETGGYSSGDINSLRARGISPIRSVYSNAQRGLNRQRALSGGYSPNYNAASTRLARDQSGQIAEATTNVNAKIAEMIAAGKMSAAPLWASAAAHENDRFNDFNQHNTDILNQIAQANALGRFEADKFNTAGFDSMEKFNASGKLETDRFNTGNRIDTDRINAAGINDVNKQNEANRLSTESINANILNSIAQANQRNQMETERYNNELRTSDAARQTEAQRYADEQNARKFAQQMEAIKSMQSLYGTTPGLASTFGNQVMQQQGINNSAIANGLIPQAGFGGVGVRRYV